MVKRDVCHVYISVMSMVFRALFAIHEIFHESIPQSRKHRVWKLRFG
jgi:hypothetical protein